MSVPTPFRNRHDGRAAAAVSPTVEPCIECHEETEAGSPFYSARLRIERADGGGVYLCADCHARERAARNGRPLNEADLQVIADNGVVIGAGFFAV
jgi:nitrate reductase cytochrome c-type subunit